MHSASPHLVITASEVRKYHPWPLCILLLKFLSSDNVFSADIYDSATGDQQKTRYYDQHGNLTRRVIHETNSSGAFSNPLTGAVVPYIQHDTINGVLATPGDLGSAAETNVGENIFKPAHGAPV